MRLAIISDTHLPRGQRAIPQACHEELESADAILHAGDFTAYDTYLQIKDLGKPLHAVHGNVDDPRLREELPATRIVVAGGARIAMVHDAGPATGRLRRMRIAFPNADALIFGHSHIPLHETAEDGFQIFNPGSPTERRRAPAHTMGVATIRGGRIAFELLAVGPERGTRS